MRKAKKNKYQKLFLFCKNNYITKNTTFFLYNVRGRRGTTTQRLTVNTTVVSSIQVRFKIKAKPLH